MDGQCKEFNILCIEYRSSLKWNIQNWLETRQM